MAKYLDDAGLTRLWAKMKETFVRDDNYAHTDNNLTNAMVTAIGTISNKADSADTLGGYGITNAYTKTETDQAIAAAIAGVTSIVYAIVPSLPQTGEAGTIYLIDNSGDSGNSYDEYIYVGGAFEKIGTTDIDLTNYLQKTDVAAITNAEIDAILAT